MTSFIQLTQNLFFHNALLLAQVEYNYSSEGKPPSPASIIVGLLIALFLIVAMWKVFTKAGQPGWACIIPIYNLYVWCKIVGRPWWWILLMLIPFVNFIIAIILCIDSGEELRQRRRVRNRSCFTGNHFLADSRFRQRAISGPCGDSGFSTAPGSLRKAARLDLRSPRHPAPQDPVCFPLFVT